MKKEKDELSVCMAAGFLDRMIGLFSRRIDREVLIIVPCRSVHTFGMGSAIDIAFVEKGGRVLESYENVPPWRMRRCKGLMQCLSEKGWQGIRLVVLAGKTFPLGLKKETRWSYASKNEFWRVASGKGILSRGSFSGCRIGFRG